MKKALFIDRDGTLVVEPPVDFQVDSLEKLEFLPGVFRNLYFVRRQLDYELVMVSNQDGMGRPQYPEAVFNLVQDKILTAFRNDRPNSWPQDCADSPFCFQYCRCYNHETCLAVGDMVFGADAVCPDSLYDSCKDVCYAF